MSKLKLFSTNTINGLADSLAAYFPGGYVFEAAFVKGSNTRNFIDGLSQELKRSDTELNNYIAEYGIEETENLIEEWEKSIGIPDSCFPATGELLDRRNDVIIKLASLGVQTAEDFEFLGDRFGIEVNVRSGAVNGIFPMQFPTIFFEDAKTARFTIFVTFTVEDEQRFPYIFPITFGNAIIQKLKCLFQELKPANCDIIFEQI